MLAVLHSKDFGTTSVYGVGGLCSAETIKKLVAEGQYEWVCQIDTDSLDEACKLTTSIDIPWVQNEEIDMLANTVHEAGGCRSTSVGDIILDNNNHYHVVAPSGFDDLGVLPLPIK